MISDDELYFSFLVFGVVFRSNVSKLSGCVVLLYLLLFIFSSILFSESVIKGVICLCLLNVWELNHQGARILGVSLESCSLSRLCNSINLSSD